MSVGPVYGMNGSSGAIAGQLQMNKQKVQQMLQQAQDQVKLEPPKQIKEMNQPSPYGGVLFDIKI